MRRIRLRHRHEDEVCDSRAVGVQISGRDVDGLGGRRHEEASARIHRRQCSAAAVEQDEVGRQRTRDADALEDVRDRDGAGQTAAAAAAADRRDTGDDRSLEMVRGGVTAATGELEQRLQRRRDEDGLGLGRPTPPHRHDNDVQRSRELPRDVTGDGGLPDPLARSDHSERGHVDGLHPRRREAEVGPFVRHPERERAADEREPLPRAEHGLVGQVEHEVGLVVRDRRLERRLEGDAVPVDVCAELLRPADEDRSEDDVLDLFEGGAHDGRVVLSVDDRDSTSRRAHPRVVTSCSILLVYFSYSNVSVENWMMRSSPWNGCLREMETWCPLTSITL